MQYEHEILWCLNKIQNLQHVPGTKKEIANLKHQIRHKELTMAFSVIPFSPQGKPHENRD